MSTDPVEHLSKEGLDASAASLNDLTDSATDHSTDPQSHIHRPADHDSSHSWIKKWLPSAAIGNLENRYHLGNWVADRKTGEKSWESMSIYVRLGMHLLYYGTYQEKFLEWPSTTKYLKEQSEKMGREYDTPESKAHIAPFITSFQLEPTLSELAEPDPNKYSTFNEFFARALRPDARPVEDLTNELTAVSPADCRLTAFPTIDLATKYWIKGAGFTLDRLFGDADLAREMDGGSMIIARLAPQDYHRWHSPVSGTVQRVADIPGAYYTVNPQAINESGTLDVFCENKRSVMLVKRAPTGRPCVIVAVGAMLVGSMEYVGGVENPGSVIKRGQTLGKFLYGGSTVIVCFPKDEIVLDEDLVKRSTDPTASCETLMKVGWRIGSKA